jgi:hypothetical protein
VTSPAVATAKSAHGPGGLRAQTVFATAGAA